MLVKDGVMPGLERQHLIPRHDDLRQLTRKLIEFAIDEESRGD
jgi:hypothetical protein